jgi:hypothetical protein
MRAKMLCVALLASASCKKDDEAARPAQSPAVPTGELGRAGDRLLEASAQATWVALCRGEEGILILDEHHEVPFHILVDHDQSGRWVVLARDAQVQLLDTWTHTTSPLPGDGHNLAHDGARLAYRLEYGVAQPVVVRELASGEERIFGDEPPRIGWHRTSGHLDRSGRFLYLDTFIAASPDDQERPAEQGSCVSSRGTDGGQMGRLETTVVALDEPGTPRHPLPPSVDRTRATLDGWPLFATHDSPGHVQRWTPAGVETLLEVDTWLDADEYRGGFVYRAQLPAGVMLLRYAEGRAQVLAPSSTEHNAAAPDSFLVGADTGVARATDHRWVHLDTGAVIQADASTEHAYADATRVLLLGNGGATLVDPASGAILHRYAVAARPSLARGSWVALRGNAETVVLDLQRARWVGHAPPSAVALAETGHVLVAATAGEQPTGPFHWSVPRASTDVGAQ